MSQAWPAPGSEEGLSLAGAEARQGLGSPSQAEVAIEIKAPAQVPEGVRQEALRRFTREAATGKNMSAGNSRNESLGHTRAPFHFPP